MVFMLKLYWWFSDLKRDNYPSMVFSRDQLFLESIDNIKERRPFKIDNCTIHKILMINCYGLLNSVNISSEIGGSSLVHYKKF